MFVARSINNTDPQAETDPAIVQKIANLESSVTNLDTSVGVATSNNTPDTIVKRNATGDFSAGTVSSTRSNRTELS